MAIAYKGMRTRPPEVAGFILLAFFALFLGLASALLPAWFVFSALLIPCVAMVLLARPEYALTACIALVCGLIHPAFVPRLPILGGALAAADATLAMLAIYAGWTIAVRTDQVKSPPVAGAHFLAISTGVFGICLAVAVATSLGFLHLNKTHVLGETRDLLYLVVLPIAVVILRQHERQERFVFSIVVLGCLFSVGQILQGVFNLPVFGNQGMSTLETLGQQAVETTRAMTLGDSVIIFSLLLTVGAYVLGLIRKSVFFAVAGLLLLGIFLTYGRTTYAATLVCLGIVVVWLNPRKLPHLIGLLAIAVFIGVAVGMIWKPDSLAAVFYRMTSVREEINHGYSAQWRFREAEAMLPHIWQHPLAGIGLGADYKGASGSSARPDLNYYVHNAYLYMAGKMGLPALAAFLSAMAAIFLIGRRSAMSDASPWARTVGAAGAAMMVRFVFASITEPHFMSDYGVVNIAIAGALVYLSARHPILTGSTTKPIPARKTMD